MKHLIPLTCSMYFEMLIKNKRELFWLRHRFRIVISVFSVVGLVFGINTNIRMAVLPADWEALFFLAVDVCIILAVCRSRDAKMRVTSLIALTAAMMLTSHLIMQIKGDFAFDYAYRILYLMLFYFSAGYVVNCTMRRRMTFPTPEEWAKIQEKEGENDD